MSNVGVCSACGGRPSKGGDLLCSECWPLIARELKQAWLRAWRLPRGKGRALELAGAERAIIEAARAGR